MTTFLTIEEAAARLRLGQSSIRRYIRSGKLPAKKLTGGRQVLIEERDLMSLLNDARTRNESVPSRTDKMPTALELLRMSPEERTPFLIASVEAALPLCAADLARPPHERELTADLETGEFYTYDAQGRMVREENA